MTHPWVVVNNYCIQGKFRPRFIFALQTSPIHRPDLLCNPVIKELWPGHGFLLCVVYDLDLGDMTWIKVMTHPWVMDNNCVKVCPIQYDRSYDSDTDFGYVCSNLDLGS